MTAGWRALVGRAAPHVPLLARGVEASRRLFERTRTWLPPWHRREFWAVQALVLVIDIPHSVIEGLHVVDLPSALYLVPVTFYLIPVVYAALNFGVRGSVPTALWCTVLTLPNLLIWHTGLQREGVIVQLIAICVIAVFVGVRVDHESRARQEAESRARAHLAAEQRYRSLFDHVADPILLLDASGEIVEVNDAAARLFGMPHESLPGRQVDSIVGSELAAVCLGAEPSGALRLSPVGGQSSWVEPRPIRISDPDGRALILIVLRDVTLRYERERALEGYTRQALVAREEERRRIARDLHDGPLQSLVLLMRKLDLVDELVEPVVTESLGEARGIAEGVAGELRRFSRELRPSVLDDLGLAAALKAEATALARRSDLSVECRVTGAMRRLAPELELTFLRIEQEALHNIERHARATSARVHLAFARAAVRLSVEDNGSGVEHLPPPSELLAAGKMGIVGMQERAHAAGATLRVDRSALGGTRVELVAG
jgi:PAS domain S-box-containing protein